MPQIGLAVYRLHRGYAKVKDQQSHGDGKYAIAEGSQPFYTLARDLIVGHGHT